MFVLTCPVVLFLHSSHLPAPPSRVVLPVSVEEVSTNGGPCLKMNHEEKEKENRSSLFNLCFSPVLNLFLKVMLRQFKGWCAQKNEWQVMICFTFFDMEYEGKIKYIKTANIA